MTPYELATALHRELSPVVPKLSAALNRALVDIGEGSVLVLPEAPVDVSFSEKETVSSKDGADVLSKIFSSLPLLEQHSRWRVAVDRQRASEPEKLELVYTLYRVQSCKKRFQNPLSNRISALRSSEKCAHTTRYAPLFRSARALLSAAIS